MIKLPKFLVLLTVYLVFASQAHAQEPTRLIFDFSQAYQDYLYTIGQYRKSHQDYIAAKQSYLSYKTLSAKNQCQEKTSQMLKLRDEAIRTYLTALRLKLSELTKILVYEQNMAYLKLESEISWYAKHQDKITSAASLEDLLQTAKETEERYKETEVLAFQTLGLILSYKEESFQAKIEESLSSLNEKTSQIRTDGKKDTTKVERWLLDAQNKITRAKEKRLSARQIINKMKSPDQDKVKTFDSFLSTIAECHQYLKETNSYLKEIIGEIKKSD